VTNHQKHTRNLRKGRWSGEGQIYLVTTRSNQRQKIFLQAASAHILIDEINQGGLTGSCITLAYVIMPDHLHWLFELGEGPGLSQIIKRVKGSAARRINAVRLSTGRLWQPGFHDHAIRNSQDIEPIANYVLNNPVRAGLVTNPEDYPFKYSAWLSKDGRG
jgi:putative transposase